MGSGEAKKAEGGCEEEPASSLADDDTEVLLGLELSRSFGRVRGLCFGDDAFIMLEFAKFSQDGSSFVSTFSCGEQVFWCAFTTLSKGVPGSTSSGMLSDTRKVLGLFILCGPPSSLILDKLWLATGGASLIDESRLVSISSAELFSQTDMGSLVTDIVLDSTEDRFCFFI